MKSCSLSGVCLTKCFHQGLLIEAICLGSSRWHGPVFSLAGLHTQPTYPVCQFNNYNVYSNILTNTYMTLFVWLRHKKWSSDEHLYFFSQVVCGLRVWPNLPPIYSSDPLFINWFNLDHAPDARIVIVSCHGRAPYWGRVWNPGPIKGRPAVQQRNRLKIGGAM